MFMNRQLEKTNKNWSSRHVYNIEPPNNSKYDLNVNDYFHRTYNLLINTKFNFAKAGQMNWMPIK